MDENASSPCPCPMQPEAEWAWDILLHLIRVKGGMAPQIFYDVCQEQNFYCIKDFCCTKLGGPFFPVLWTVSTGISRLLAFPVSCPGYIRQKKTQETQWRHFSVAIAPSPPAFSPCSKRNREKFIYSIFQEAEVFWCPLKLLFSFKITFSHDSSMTGFINGQMSYFFRYWTLPHK